jgi:hypothetical protein
VKMPGFPTKGVGTPTLPGKARRYKNGDHTNGERRGEYEEFGRYDIPGVGRFRLEWRLNEERSRSLTHQKRRWDSG